MDDETKQKKPLLLVDDDEFLLDMYAVKFREEGFDVLALRSADEALTKLREGYAPAIILLDMIMPVLDGIEFLKIMRKEKLAPDAAVIVLSNQSDEAEVDEAKKLGAKGYILKANTIPSEVLEQVRKLAN
jgi:CheY-like chemotaxis protein